LLLVSEYWPICSGEHRRPTHLRREPLRRLFLAAVQLMRNVRTSPTFVAANTPALRR